MDRRTTSAGYTRRRQGASTGFALPMLAGAVAALLFGLLFMVIDRAWKQELVERQHSALASEAASLRSQLETVLNGAVQSTIGLAAYAYARPDLTEEEFERIAARIHREQPEFLRSLTLARGEVIEHVYPREGNEDVIGMNIAEHPQQGPSFRQVLASGRTVVAGPWPLVQGGQALLVRSPVDTAAWGAEANGVRKEPVPWSMSSIALDFDAILREAGLYPPSPHLALALRGRDGKGAEGEAFYNPAGIAIKEAMFRYKVSFSGGDWEMLVKPGPDYGNTGRPLAWWLLGVVGTLAVGGYAYRVGNSLHQGRRSLSLYQRLVNSLEDATLVVSGRRVLWANPAFVRMIGEGSGRGASVESLGFIHPEDLEQLPRGLDFSRAAAEPHGREVRVRMAGGNYRFHMLRWVPIEWDDAAAVLLTLVDVHENRVLFDALAEAHDLQDALFEAMPGHALVIDADGRIRRSFGESRGAALANGPLVGHRLQQLLPADTARELEATVRRALQEGRLQEVQYRLEGTEFHHTAGRDRSPSPRWFEARIRPIAASFEGQPAVVWHALDVTERKQLEERLQTLAWEDPLTGVANRAALERAFPRLAARADRQGGLLALLFIDVDQFKPVNDRYGHAVGDELLQQLAQRLAHRIRPEDLLVRMGGDEFVVLTAPLHNREEGRALAQRLQHGLAAPFEIQPDAGESLAITLTCSIGQAFYPEDGEQLVELVSAADRAMYGVKASGRDGLALADPGCPADDAPGEEHA